MGCDSVGDEVGTEISGDQNPGPWSQAGQGCYKKGHHQPDWLKTHLSEATQLWCGAEGERLKGMVVSLLSLNTPPQLSCSRFV